MHPLPSHLASPRIARRARGFSPWRRWSGALALWGLCGPLGALGPFGLVGLSVAHAQTAVPATQDHALRLQQAATDPAVQSALLRAGRTAAAVCAYCHGEGGNSTKSEVPNLAGQNPAYLLEQVHQFADGRRKNEFMQGMIKALKDDEKVGVVLYFSRQTVLPRAGGPAAWVAQGKMYYERTCFRCHGADGHGTESMARIAGQQTDYLTQTLKRYRSGSGERINALMAANTKLMTDADIQAVVAYVASMP